MNSTALFPRSRLAPLALVSALLLVLGARAQTAAPGAGWNLSGQLQQGFSSNVLLSPDHPTGDATSTLTLDVKRLWAGPRWTFSAEYLPQGEAFAHNPDLDFFSQAYNQAWTYALGPHTGLSWTTQVERYPERAGAPQFSGAGVEGVAQASQAAALASVLTGGSSGLNFTHQYSLRGSWSAGLNGSLQSFSTDAAIARNLEDSGGLPATYLTEGRNQSLAGTASWSYQLTPGRSLQLGGTVSDFWLQPGQHRRNADLQVSLQQQLGAGLELSAGAGPAWNWLLTGSPAAAGALPSAGYAANAGLSRQSGASRYGLSWQHALQPSLVPGGITTDSLALQWNRQWNPAWSTGASVGQSRFNTLGAGAAGAGNRSSLFTSGQLGYSTAHWTLSAQASYDTQDMPAAVGWLPVRRLQASAGISYTLQGAH